ncbi:MAG: hypothetical protein ACOCRO_03670 [Halanaerobiales bacterium]
MQKRVYIMVFLFICIFMIPVSLLAEGNFLNNPDLVESNPSKPYRLLNSELHLPDLEQNELDIYREEELINYVALYIGRNFNNNVFNMRNDLLYDYRDNRYEIQLNKDEEEHIISMNPLPGVLLQADFNREEEDQRFEEDSSISLKYWLNNRTMIRAEHGIERTEWWDIRDITLENEENSIYPAEELVYNEEKSESSRLGIDYRGNERLTFSADLINDLASYDKDYSTYFTIQYEDESGVIRYINQNDFGDIKAHINSIEFGYRDLATLHTSYKVVNPKRLEEKFQESIWDIGLDFNLNDISSLSFGYQFKEGRNNDFDNEQEDNESNINAQFEFEF